MRVSIAGLALLACTPIRIWCEEAPPADEVVSAVKVATVRVLVQGVDWKVSGSGLVVRRNKDVVYVATNYRLLAGPHASRAIRPTEAVRLGKAATVRLVFGSGTKGERTAKAETVAVDADADLAILRVTGLADAPPPLDLSIPAKPFETMSVWAVGFPDGKSPEAETAPPTVSVSRASVSSLRLGDDRELAAIDFEGKLNPGSSGGPVVSGKGLLVGLVVAKIRDGKHLGYAIPAAELNRLLAGGLGSPHVSTIPDQRGDVKVRTEIGVTDWNDTVREVTLHYVVASNGAKWDRSRPLDKSVDAKQRTLKVEGGVATGEIVLDNPTGELLIKVTYDGPGRKATPVRSLELTSPVLLSSGKAPPGWAVWSSKANGFTVWLPDGATRPFESERVAVLAGRRIRSPGVRAGLRSSVNFTLDFRVNQLYLPGLVAGKFRKDEVEDGLRDWLATDFGGKVIEETDVQLGDVSGREYQIEADGRASRVRVFVAENRRVLVLQVTGSKAAVNSEYTPKFLNSCHPAPGDTPRDPFAGPGLAETISVIEPGQPPKSVGSPFGSEFRELSPDRGLLIGLEVQFGGEPGKSAVQSARPIYRVAGKEILGQQRGRATGSTFTLKADPGYAIGALTARSVLGISGLSVTFMKVAGEVLDPRDAYESAWIGGDPDGVGWGRLDGGGTPAVGWFGRAERNNLGAIGLVFRGQEKTIGMVVPFGTRATQILGGGIDPEFYEANRDGSLMVGLEVGIGKWFDQDVVRAVRPVYRRAEKDVRGNLRGAELDRVVKLVAKPGYALGAVTLKVGAAVNGVSVTFMKVTDGKLNPADAYESEWAGGTAGPGPFLLSGEGTPVLGIVGKTGLFNSPTGLGLLYKSDGEAVPKDVAPIDVPQPAANVLGPTPQMLGFPMGPVFRELGPEGAWLIGLELGQSQELGRDVVRSVRAIYGIGGLEVLGQKRGTATGRVLTLKAKSGYAIGAIAAKSALEIQGMMVTFMKVADGKLDPTNTYESDWVGTNSGIPVKKLDAHGSPVVGLNGRADEKGLIAIGPVFQGQENGLGPVPPSGTRHTQIVGGAYEPEQQEMFPEGRLLVGFEFGLGKYFNRDIVIAVRPIFRTGDKEELGRQLGSDTRRLVKMVAKPGFAVGRLTTSGGGVSLTFMKVQDGKLNPLDLYESDWAGEPKGFQHKLGGNGSLIVGLQYKEGAEGVTGLGLVLKGDGIAEGGGTAPRPIVRKLDTRPYVFGPGRRPAFREVAPAGGLLVGLEISLTSERNLESVQSVRAIYRIGEKDEFGETRGMAGAKVVTVKAKNGYAIGAITAEVGRSIQGMEVVFMKIKEGNLDPTDSYVSDWVGSSPTTLPTKVDGSGKPVVGLTGQADDKGPVAFGPVFSGQK